MNTATLTERFLQQDERALARAISLVEANSPAGKTLLKNVRQHAGKARIIGITGSPGSGKSTFTDRLIGAARDKQRRVAVVAVDPTSPYSGGAILGDRIRMTRWHQDPDVYIRSMATRGHLGGLAAATLQVITLLDAYGFDDIFIETVGVGQSEVEIVEVANTTLLLLTPGQGDGVQAFKAGIMEIADIFVINKFDQPGGSRLKREIKATLELAHPEEGAWHPPIQETIASQDKGTQEVYDLIAAHHTYLKDNGQLRSLKQRRDRSEISAILTEQIKHALANKDDNFIKQILQGELSPQDAITQLVTQL